MNITFIRPNYARLMLRELGIRPPAHLPRHSAASHPRGDEPGRSGAGAVSNGMRYDRAANPRTAHYGEDA